MRCCCRHYGSGFPAHFVETAAGTDAADDKEDDEDHDRRHRHAHSDRLEVIEKTVVLRVLCEHLHRV